MRIWRRFWIDVACGLLVITRETGFPKEKDCICGAPPERGVREEDLLRRGSGGGAWRGGEGTGDVGDEEGILHPPMGTSV